MDTVTVRGESLETVREAIVALDSGSTWQARQILLSLETFLEIVGDWRARQAH